MAIWGWKMQTAQKILVHYSVSRRPCRVDSTMFTSHTDPSSIEFMPLLNTVASMGLRSIDI